jgi:hypothetical protein
MNQVERRRWKVFCGEVMVDGGQVVALSVFEETDVDVRGEDGAGGASAGEPSCDGSVARSQLQTAPFGMGRPPFDHLSGDGIAQVFKEL